MWCDLHLHSDLSDGAFPPARVVDLVADAGVGLLALTDHDTTAGHEAARSRAFERRVTFVGGIEMTTYSHGKVVHVLGLGVRDGDPAVERCNAVAMRVWEANERRWVRALEREGHGITEAMILPDGPLLLPALVERLCRHGIDGGDPVRCHERFKRFFGALGQEAYGDLASPAIAAEAIRHAGGVSILAHPARLDDDGLAELLADELDGIEALYAKYSTEEREALIALASRLRKPYSCGSDYHGFFEAAYVNPRFEPPRELLERLGVASR